MTTTSMLDRLLDQLDARGLRIERGKKLGELLLRGPDKEKTPAILEALKAFKPQLLERFKDLPTVEPWPTPVAKPEPKPELCRVCGKDVSDPETRERMADPLHCDRGGSKAVTDGNGNERPETQRCPFKERT